MKKEPDMKSVKKVAVVVLAVLSVISAEPEEHTFESHYGEDIIAKQKVIVDEEEQYMIARIIPVKGKLISTVNLHDFAAGFTAIKDEARDTCYILETSHTLREMMDSFVKSIQVNGFFDMTKAFECTHKKYIPNSELDHYGDRVAKFCEGHELVRADKHFLNRRRRSTLMIAGTSIACGVCLSWNCG